MTKLEIIRQWMAEGKILHPLERTPSIVDMVRTLMTLCGYREFKETHWVKTLKRDLLDDAARMRPSRHYVLTIIDGLGTNLREYFPPGGFFETYYLRELRSVFPSTTACALTSLVSGEWPGMHGLTGWFTHLPEIGHTAKILPFVDRFTDAPLESFGAQIKDLIPVPSLLPSLERDVCAILPNAIRDGAYSKWAHGQAKTIGYRSLSGGFQAVSANIQNRDNPSFTYFYVPDVDAAQHEGGTGSGKVRRLIKSLDEALLKLRDSMPDGTKVVVSADHGVLDVPEKQQLRITDGHPLLKYLEVAPSGEPAMPIFHIKDGTERRFEDFFANSFGSVMELISIADAEALALFGADGIGPVTRRRLGSYIGISHVPFAMMYDQPGAKPLHFMAYHGGLQPEAMRVPLFVA